MATNLGRISVRQFLEDQAAPDGFVYTWEDRPFAQVEVSDQDYTLFWLGTADARTIATFARLIAENAARFLGTQRDILWSVDVAAFDKPDASAKYQLSEEPVVRDVSSIRLLDSIGLIYRKYPGASAYYVSLESEWRGKPLLIDLWADSPESRSSQPEVGLTSPVPLAAPALELFKSTVRFAKSIPLDVITDLFVNDIA